MKTEVMYSKGVHNRNRSHDVMVVKINGGIRLKMTYECYNGVERFTGDLFSVSDNDWKHFFSLLDLGIEPDTTKYVQHELEREERSKVLHTLGIEFYKTIFQVPTIPNKTQKDEN